MRPGTALDLLDGYLRSLAVGEPPPPGLAAVIGSHLLDLVADVLGASRDAAEGRRTPSAVRAATSYGDGAGPAVRRSEAARPAR